MTAKTETLIRVLNADEIDAVFGGVGSKPMPWNNPDTQPWIELDRHPIEVPHDPVDVGGLFHTWFRALGVNPEETHYRNGGQPLPIAHES